jgi:hypothetical protein
MDTLKSENQEFSQDTAMLNYTLKKIDHVKSDLEAESHLRTAATFFELVLLFFVAFVLYTKKKSNG